MERRTRIPTQKRSLEKYEKILTAAFKLFNEQGYFNVTTADIAKEADVATGSVYSYFKDKKDIYIEVRKRISQQFTQPTHDFWEENCHVNFQDAESIKGLFQIFIKLMMQHHNFSKLFHDDMMALDLLDKEIAALTAEHEQLRIQNTLDVFTLIAIPFKNQDSSDVFLHYCNVLIDDVCHQILYDKSIRNTDLYIEQSVDLLYRLLQNLADI